MRYPLSIAALVLLSCARVPSPQDNPLMNTVPSRAVAVMQFPHMEKALGFVFDSTSVFRKLDYGRLGDSGMVLSYGYGAGLIPLLAFDAGRAGADTSSAVRKILSQAEELKLHAFYTGAMLPKRSAVLLSPSRAAVDEAVGHIESGVSVLDAPNFRDALSLADAPCGSLMLKNGSALRWLPSSFSADGVDRRSLIRFTNGVSEWTILNFSELSRKEIGVRLYDGGQKKYLSSHFGPLPAGDCRLQSALPDNASFVVDLPLKEWKRYLDSWKECLDARENLVKYKARLAALKKSTGNNPETWLAEVNPAEIALVRWNGREVLLVRRSRKSRSSELSANPFRGFVPALFGNVFSLADDSFMASRGVWTVFGSGEDVAAWLDADKPGNVPGLPKKAKCFVINNGFGLTADSGNIVLNVN